MDEADITQEREERMMAALKRQVQRVELEPTGVCHWCGEGVPHPQKFCDVECSSDWQYAKKRGKING